MVPSASACFTQDKSSAASRPSRYQRNTAPTERGSSDELFHEQRIQTRDEPSVTQASFCEKREPSSNRAFEHSPVIALQSLHESHFLRKWSKDL